MGKFKLIAIDIDGTLLNDRHEVSLRNRKAIRKAMDHGIHVSLVTGRVYRSALFYADQLELRDPLIVCNGALVKDRQGVVWRSDRLDLSLTGKLLEFAEFHGVYAKVYVGDLLLVKEDNEEARNFVKTHRINYEVIGKLSLNVTAQPDLIVFKGQSEALPKLAQQIRAEFGAAVSMTQSFPTSLEIMAARVSKREALQWLANRLAVPRETVLAIGNSLNDLEMLEWAGQGIAMANSDSLLKASRPDLSEFHNNHDGVAAILERYVLQV
jgi:Cof subfamily protein (haloacid dehalogenase superfamily)